MPGALQDAPDLDGIARSLFAELTALAGVRKVGLALSEGGGRRLRFLASDSVSEGPLDWCHIDAYDDVPLTGVVRSGEAIFSARGGMDGKYAGFVAGQPEQVRSLAVVPLPGTGEPVGGLIIYFDETGDVGAEQQRHLTAVAVRAAEAVDRVRAARRTEAATAAQSGGRRLVLDGDPRSVGRARHFLRDLLHDAGISDELAETAQLCLSELATNAAIHTRGSYELQVLLDPGLLTVVVRDRGGEGAVEQGSDADPLRVYGRGLQLVEALADRWGSERDARGSTVWFELQAG